MDFGGIVPPKLLFLVNLRYGISLGLLVISSVIQTNTISKISYWILLTRKSVISTHTMKPMMLVIESNTTPKSIENQQG